MLNLLFMMKKKKYSLEDKIQFIQKGETEYLNDLIRDYKPFIAKTVSTVCKKYITDTDDEYSVGLIAFHDAILKYNSERGKSLVSFAEILIKRRVIDYIRSQPNFSSISLDAGDHADDGQYESTTIEAELSIEHYKKHTDKELRQEEIVQYTKVISKYGITLKDLVNESPKHEDARKNAIQIAKVMIENEELKDSLLTKKRLPIKKLEPYVTVSRKTIERNRKYIIAVSLILLGDYVYLQDYIKGVLET